MRADVAMYTAKSRGRNQTVATGDIGSIRVYHCDDSDAYRRLVQVMLGDYPDIELVGAASSYADALAEAPALAPDVMLIDLHTGDESADPVGRVRAAVPAARVVVLSGSDTQALARMRAHADVALAKSGTFDEIAAALRGA